MFVALLVRTLSVLLLVDFSVDLGHVGGERVAHVLQHVHRQLAGAVLVHNLQLVLQILVVNSLRHVAQLIALGTLEPGPVRHKVVERQLAYVWTFLGDKHWLLDIVRRVGTLVCHRRRLASLCLRR